MNHLSDKEKKKIIARYIELQNYRACSREFGIGESTIRKIVKSNPDITSKCAKKREQNSKEMIEFLDTEKGRAQELLVSIMNEMGNRSKLERAGIKDLATAFGIIVDKFVMLSPQQTERGNELLQSLYALETRND